MHNHVRLKIERLPTMRRPNDEFRGVLFDSYRFGPKMKLNAKFARSLNQLINQVWVKKGEGTRPAM
jgi:hypothetical protein